MSHMALSLEKKIVFITGASSGIGKASAEQFAAAGANLILTARRKERLETLAQELRRRHSVNVLPLPLDVQDRERVETLIRELPEPWRAIDILLNNAGLALSTDKLQDADPANWDTMIQVNLCGLLYVTRAILPGMIVRDSGHIINVSSTAGHDYYPRGNVYSATKHAVKAISHSLRLDLIGTPLRVTEIAPRDGRNGIQRSSLARQSARQRAIHRIHSPIRRRHRRRHRLLRHPPSARRRRRNGHFPNSTSLSPPCPQKSNSRTSPLNLCSLKIVQSRDNKRLFRRLWLNVSF